jgi:uncharacterized protein with PQ loop repeat
MSLTDALAIVATLVFLGRLLPQPVRLARTGLTAGVSPMAALNSVVSAVAWLAYGLMADLPVVWASALVAMVPGTWQVVLLRGQVARRDVAGSAVFAGALVVAAILGVLGVALGGAVLVTVGPQVRYALVSDDLSGLAPATYWVALVDAVAWGAYGVAVRDGALVGYFLALSISAVVILSRLAAQESRRIRILSQR